MADGMPYFKPQKTPVESFEESLEDIEKQASLLFEEFLNLPQTANSKLNSKLTETSDSPVIRDHSNFKRAASESNEVQDDLVTDCEILVKGSSNAPSPHLQWQHGHLKAQ
ncbi:hypothetical protein OS493_008097 [Desmophyllum pertusum]|uniref:Uncharacterized protein n=1 Tax=Desmophyllum pertusum TaxID=174260 RepID=A0A9X0CHP9_9CNID|nr:hypothetical protein OS493_008097 [Desmophyllum pertusum]